MTGLDEAALAAMEGRAAAAAVATDGKEWLDHVEGETVAVYDPTAPAGYSPWDTIADVRDPAVRSFLAGAHTDVVALLAEVRRLRALLDGRSVRPTRAEVIAHCEAGGAWLIVDSRKRVVGSPFAANAVIVEEPDAMVSRDALQCLTWLLEVRLLRAVPLDRDRRPCAWPVTP